MAPRLRPQSRYAAWSALVLGVLIFAVPLVVGPDTAWHHFSNYTVGPIVVLLSGLTIATPHRRMQGALASGGLEALLGAWVFATAWLAPAEPFYLVANAVLGTALVITSVWALTIGLMGTRRPA